VRAWVCDAGRRAGAGLAVATPYGILAFLTASAVAPVAASLGTGGELTVVLDQLGGMGSGYLADVLAGTAQRMRAGDGTAERWRDELAAELLRRLEAGGSGAEALRDEMAQVLRAVDAVGAAVAESARGDESLRRELTAALGRAGGRIASPSRPTAPWPRAPATAPRAGA
jgi:hypothetical protein